MARILVLASWAAAVAAVAALAGGADSESTPRPVAMRIGGGEAAGFFKEATGFDSATEVSRAHAHNATAASANMGKVRYGAANDAIANVR